MVAILHSLASQFWLKNNSVAQFPGIYGFSEVNSCLRETVYLFLYLRTISTDVALIRMHEVVVAYSIFRSDSGGGFNEFIGSYFIDLRFRKPQQRRTRVRK